MCISQQVKLIQMPVISDILLTGTAFLGHISTHWFSLLETENLAYANLVLPSFLGS